MEIYDKTLVYNKDLIGRTAAQFIYEINNIKGSVFLIYKDKIINAKSFVGLLQLGIKKGESFILRIDDSKYKNDLNKVIETLEV